MKIKPLNILILFLFLTLPGCATSSVNTAIKQGATPLDTEAIFNLVTGNTLHLVSSDLDAYIFHSPDGTLSASSASTTNLDSGSWDIKSDDKICIKFDVWYHGDVHCYPVYKEGGQTGNYLFFTSNGALAYTAAASTGNSQHLKVKTKKETFVRGIFGKDQKTERPKTAPAVTAPAPERKDIPVNTTGPGASSTEINYTVKNMAKNCPGCNLAGADLRKANLIGANLKGANLSGADLSRANLRRSNLEGADLSGATLLSSNLPGANLKNADLTGADLTGSNLIKADFTGATLNNTILENTHQEGVKGMEK